MVREWLLRIVLIVAGPLLFLGLLEGVLRVGGVGYPTEFFLHTEGHWATNERFGWRFFPREIARTPNPEVVASGKRLVCVLGESAAMGFPDPAFGLAAYLQSALGDEWRVVNAAMTAINSHVIRGIAEECASLKPQAFVIYMGNNEVIGPYGAGSVFGAFSGNLAVIRAQLWARSLRTGQVIASLAEQKQAGFDEWRGLQFFVQNQVSAEDPRLGRVYHHFADNLRRIIRMGQRSGARVVVSTVAVNLKDCPPFASLDGRAQQAFERGSYSEARDLDALRFRADSKINGIIREVVQQENATLVDEEKAIAPTRENFWEHVHLRPEANRRLAELVGGVLTGETRRPRLVVSGWDEERMRRTILGSMEHAPFTAAHRAAIGAAQPGRAADARQAWEQRVQNNPEDLVAGERLAELYMELGDFPSSESVYRKLLGRLAIRTWQTGLGEALLKQGRFRESADVYQAAAKIDDRFAPAYVGLGVADAAQDNLAAAEADLRRAVALQPRMAEAHNSLGRVLQSRSRVQEAVQEYRLAIDAKPEFSMARYNLAGALAGLNQTAEAIAQLESAVKSEPDFAAAQYDLGVLLAKAGRLEEAVAHYAEAVRLNPKNADAFNNWGTALARLNRRKEAQAKFEAALALDGRHAAARRNLELLMK